MEREEVIALIQEMNKERDEKESKNKLEEENKRLTEELKKHTDFSKGVDVPDTKEEDKKEERLTMEEIRNKLKTEGDK